MKLGGKFIAKEIENEMRDRLNTLDLGSLVEDEINGRGDIVGYIEGPPTMNGEPHVGHLRGRIIKDLWYRYNIFRREGSYLGPGGIAKVFL
jgi:isoleucyl-tRNA synthetase